MVAMRLPRHPAGLSPLVVLAVLFAACTGSSPTQVGVRVLPGGPLDGLSRAERAAFERGKLVFQRRFVPEEGLGPRYNATSCESCHSTPVVGGSAPLYRNFYLGMQGVPGAQTPLTGLTSAVVPAYGDGNDFMLDVGRRIIPEDGAVAIVTAQRNALPLFGVGLFEFIGDATLLSHCDPDDADGDGISGRFNTDAGALGRFGVKAQSNNVEVFTRAPLKNQLGITSDPFMGSGAVVGLGHALRFALQVSTDPNAPTTDFDDLPDPEISRTDLGDLIAFTRFLAPPQQIQPLSASAQRGKALFGELGCAKCHVPELSSSRGPVRAYSDLLLHDMGPDLADELPFGLPQASRLAPANTAAEFRTQPLWGVSLSAPFLHDGRAETLAEAIELHGGEARAIRDAFLARPTPERADLIVFLEHL
ncbi:MAG: hypothetical protein EXS08_00265 [Planctomycetes bacterium]|nr:hypothetical protein [Planctomycetota bacterium]